MLNILLLPVDILINIFKKLTLLELHNTMLTCKAFRNLIINDNTIWRSVCRDKLILNNPLDNSKKLQLSWYNRCRVSHNWCNGYYRSKGVVHHYSNYMPWVVFHNSEVLVLSVGSELHCYPTDKRGLPNCREALWKLDVPKIIRNDVRTNDISRFIIKDQLLACGNRDGCVAVYSFHNIYRKPKLQCHIQDCHDNGHLEVTAVEMIYTNDKVVVVSGSNNSPNVMLCQLTEDSENKNGTSNDYYSTTYTSTYENTGVRCLAVSQGNDKVAIGLNGNSKPLLLDVNNGKFVMTADSSKNIKQAVRDIRWRDENTIVYVTHSGILQIIDTRTHEVVFSIRDPFQSTLYCVKSDGENAIMVGSAEYSRCVLFDSRIKSHHVQMYFTQKKTSPVYSLDFDATKLITAVDRGVAVLNFNIDTTSIEQRDYSHVFS